MVNRDHSVMRVHRGTTKASTGDPVEAMARASSGVVPAVAALAPESAEKLLTA